MLTKLKCNTHTMLQIYIHYAPTIQNSWIRPLILIRFSSLKAIFRSVFFKGWAIQRAYRETSKVIIHLWVISMNGANSMSHVSLGYVPHTKCLSHFSFKQFLNEKWYLKIKIEKEEVVTKIISNDCSNIIYDNIVLSKENKKNKFSVNILILLSI